MAEAKKGGHFWPELKKQLILAKWLNFVLLVITATALPLIEAILVNKWTNTPPSPSAGWALFAVGVVHGLLAIYLIAQQVSSPALALAEAVELNAKVGDCCNEIKRRSESYRLVRSLFDILNARKCEWTVAAQSKAELAQSFRGGLDPILTKLQENIGLILGVTSNRFTIEVWFLDGYEKFSAGGEEVHLVQERVCGDRLSPSTALVSELNVLSAYCFAAKAGFQQSIDNVMEILGPEKGNDCCFKRFVFSHIYRPCTDEKAGIILVTSMQEEAFADDAVDTLGFFAGVIANYTNAFLECVDAAQHRLQMVGLITISGKDPEPSGSWSLYGVNGGTELFGSGIRCTFHEKDLQVELLGGRTLHLKQEQGGDGLAVYKGEGEAVVTFESLGI